LEHWEYLATPTVHAFSELLPGEPRSLQTRPPLIGKFIGNAVGPHHPLLAWFCNFSHTQQWQLLPMPGEETVGTGCVKISVSGIAAVFGATIANSDPANAVPVLIAMDEFNLPYFESSQSPGNMCLWVKKYCRYF
jgi:hypothetical protein